MRIFGWQFYLRGEICVAVLPPGGRIFGWQFYLPGEDMRIFEWQF